MTDVWIDKDKLLHAPFDTHGYGFYKGGRGIATDPSEAWFRLFAVKGDETIEIPTIAALEGRVDVRTPDEALAFVRLFTSLATHYLFRDSSYVEPTPTDGEPGAGQYTTEYARRKQLEPAMARRDGDAFIVERNLVDRSGKLVRVRERVGQQGDYVIVRTDTLDEHSPVAYPLYQ